MFLGTSRYQNRNGRYVMKTPGENGPIGNVVCTLGLLVTKSTGTGTTGYRGEEESGPVLTAKALDE